MGTSAWRSFGHIIGVLSIKGVLDRTVQYLHISHEPTEHTMSTLAWRLGKAAICIDPYLRKLITECKLPCFAAMWWKR